MRAGDVRAAACGIVLRKRLEDDLAARANDGLHLPGALKDGPFIGIADVDWIVLGAPGEAKDSIDEVGAVAEAACLRAVAVDGQRLASQGLHHEIRDETAVVGLKPRSVGVEDSDQVRVDSVIAVVRRYGRLGKALGFVIYRARADGIHVAPVGLYLRMNEGVTIALGG